VGRALVGTLHHPFYQREDGYLVGQRGLAGELAAGAVGKGHKTAAPVWGSRIFRVSLEQESDGRGVAHLNRSFIILAEVFAHGAVAPDKLFVIGGITQVSFLLVVDEPAAVSGVGFYHPKVGEVAGHVLVGIGAPFFVGAGDKVHP
jgi:hypothetical protein